VGDCPDVPGWKGGRPRLAPQHLEKLTGSAVHGDVADERGYWSADTKTEMDAAGFGPSQRRPPALVIPLWGVTGELVGAQARPDEPRAIKGRTVKYETQAGQRMTLDVPPRARPLLADPTVPLFVTEGPIKGDALAGAGAAVVALLGVWSWRGSNEFGGTTVLAEFEYVALADRQVFVCFDSDVMVKPAVHDAMARLADFLAHRRATVVFCYLPPGVHGEKTGVDDYLAAGRTLADVMATATPNLHRIPDSVFTETPDDDTVDLDPEYEFEAGSALLDDIDAWVARFVIFPSPLHRAAVVLWVAHTHCIDAFDDTPRLQIRSAEKRSGKSRLLELVDHLARRARLSTSMSTSYLFRSVEEFTPTVLVDEADTLWGKKADRSNEELRGLINAGFRRGATVGRIVGEGADMVPKEFSVFCPVALAGIGDLPDTISDRAVLINMRRRAPGESVEKLRRRQITKVTDQFKARLSGWSTRALDDMRDAEPVMPPGIEDRAADVWEPLLAIADAAGGRWPELGRAACVELNAEREDAEQSWGVKLLGDIKSVFDTQEVDRIRTSDLLPALAAIEESPWDDLTGRKLSWRLRSFSIKPSSHRFTGSATTSKGYLRSDFEDAWSRYLTPPPTPPGGPEHAEQRNTDPDDIGNGAAADPDNGTSDPATGADVPDVPDVPAHPGGSGAWGDAWEM
jgi:hypothetical protein